MRMMIIDPLTDIIANPPTSDDWQVRYRVHLTDIQRAEILKHYKGHEKISIGMNI